MKILLVDRSDRLVEAWRQVFEGLADVEPLQDDFFAHPADAMISPANSFGIMDGGLDAAIRAELGHHVQTRVQEIILADFHGELPVGAAVSVDTDHERWPHLISAPTMRVPEPVEFSLNAYLAFRAVLLLARREGYASVVCPGLATGIGGMSGRRCAGQMRAAYNQFLRPARIPGFEEIHRIHEALRTAG